MSQFSCIESFAWRTAASHTQAQHVHIMIKIYDNDDNDPMDKLNFINPRDARLMISLKLVTTSLMYMLQVFLFLNRVNLSQPSLGLIRPKFLGLRLA